MITKPAQCLPATDPKLKAIKRSDIFKPGEGSCPADLVCLKPDAMGILWHNLDELAEWYKETSINCGDQDNEKTDTSSDTLRSDPDD